MTQRKPLSGVAALLASKGRKGDTMLVHMNPLEVAGIAALSPRGRLTTNPETGLPEAWEAMESILPMIGAAVAIAMSGGTLTPAVAGAIGAGAGTVAATGDVKKGLVSAGMGLVGGAALGAAGNVGAEAATTAATASTTPALAVTPGTGAGTLLGELAATEATTAAAPTMGASVPELLPATSAMTGNQGSLLPGAAAPEYLTVADQAASQGWTDKAKTMLQGEPNAFSEVKGMDRLKMGLTTKDPKTDKNVFMQEMQKPTRMLPMLYGASVYSEMSADDANDRMGRKLEKEHRAELAGAYNDLQGAYRMAQPNAITGYSPYRSQMSSRTPLPTGYAAGGMTNPYRNVYGNSKWDDPYANTTGGMTFGGDAYNQVNSYSKTAGGGRKNKKNKDSGGYDAGNPGYDGIDPVTIQANLTGRYSVRPPAGFRPGIDPEFDYFQNDPDNIQISEPTTPQPYEPLQRMEQPTQPYFESILDQKKKKKGENNKPLGMAEGGIAPPSGYEEPARYDQAMMEKLLREYQGRDGLYGAMATGISAGAAGMEGYDAASARALWGEPEPYQAPPQQESEPTAEEEAWMDALIRKFSGMTGWKPTAEQAANMAAGGMVEMQGPMGNAAVPAGGITELPMQGQQPQGQPAMPDPQDIQMLAAALSGQMGDKIDVIVEMFIQKYGQEAFQVAREMILQANAQNAPPPGATGMAMGGMAQTEGLIKGSGGGMDDQVMGMIGADQPVAVSPGEYIVPADVVSGLGDGSSDAGAAELDAMAKRTRMARGGTTNQPPPFNARKVMPV